MGIQLIQNIDLDLYLIIKLIRLKGTPPPPKGTLCMCVKVAFTNNGLSLMIIISLPSLSLMVCPLYGYQSLFPQLNGLSFI